MGASTVPAVLDALVTAWTTAAPDLEVVDGQDYDPAKTNIVCVGWEGGQTDPVIGALAPANAALTQYLEGIDVACLLSSWLGTKGTSSTVRAKAFTELELLRASLAADPHLGGVAMRAYVSSYSFSQSDDGQGLMASISFTVHVDSMD